jgi:hypothetical protein
MLAPSSPKTDVMSHPSSSSTATQSLSDILDKRIALAGAVKQRTTSLQNAINAGPVDGGVLVDYLRDLTALRAQLVATRTAPGLNAYAKVYFDDATLDIQAEFVVVRDAIDATRAWFVANMPQNAQNYLLVEQIAGNGNLSYRQFTQAALATLVTQLAALSATID